MIADGFRFIASFKLSCSITRVKEHVNILFMFITGELLYTLGMPRRAPLLKPEVLLKLTRKQKAFADFLKNNPKASATEAAAQTYNVSTRKSAEVIASENLGKPEIQAYLAKADDHSQMVILQSMYSKDERLAFDAARDVQDRLHGKATQRVEQHSTSVNLNLSLSDLTS